MISINPVQSVNTTHFPIMPLTSEYASQSDKPIVFTDIYKEKINIAIWQRKLSLTIQDSVKNLLTITPDFHLEVITTPQEAFSNISKSFDGQFGVNNIDELKQDITELVDMFCCLFELKKVGIRMQSIDQAMCPKFHVDRVPCRLVTTYQGVATQWLPHEVVDHTKLGRGSNGKDDSVSGLYKNHSDIQQLNCADVALLKGALWQEDGDLGLVHRSPMPLINENRLLLTLDFVN